MRPSLTIASLLSLALACSASSACAQRNAATSDSRWLDDCRDGWRGERGRECELRAVPVRLSGKTIEVDGRLNGGVRVVGWDGDSVRVTARLQASARDDGRAREVLKGITILSDGRRIHAEGPRGWGDNTSWSVSYLVFVPRRFDLSLDANNGALGVEGVSGRLNLRTTNGSVSLANVGGDVRAHTQNGSVNVELAGTGWDGAGLDAETQNGSVRMGIPERYAAQIETGTLNGRLTTEFPVTVQGRIGRTLSLPLNGGGVTLRARTTNGSVTLSRR